MNDIHIITFQSNVLLASLGWELLENGELYGGMRGDQLKLESLLVIMKQDRKNVVLPIDASKSAIVEVGIGSTTKLMVWKRHIACDGAKP